MMAQQTSSVPAPRAKSPALFVGHGSPTNAIEDNEFSRSWAECGRTLPRPRAILCISAHWETTGTRVTAMEEPRTIHDFSGFPRPLYQMRYAAAGAPDLAQAVRTGVHAADVRWTTSGAWTTGRGRSSAGCFPTPTSLPSS